MLSKINHLSKLQTDDINNLTSGFLDKAFHAQTFLKRGMISSAGKKVDEHPGYQLTPVHMTRSKAKFQAAEVDVPFKRL